MTKVKLESLSDLLKEQLKNPKFKKIWEESEPQYQATRAIIKARLQKKLSQRQLAQKADTTQAVVSRLENMSANPTIGLLQKIAMALGRKLEIKFV